MNLDAAKKRRDERLRRSLLTVLYHSQVSPTGWVSGRTLADQGDYGQADDQKFDDDTHALALSRDLARLGLADERARERRRGQVFSIDHLDFRITAKGNSLWREEIPSVPGVYDDRLAGD